MLEQRFGKSVDGRPLTVDRKGTPKYLAGASGLDPSGLELSLSELHSEADPGLRWSRAFGVRRPLRIEIGVGNSDFLLEVARRDPDFNYLGFEYSRKRVQKFLRRVVRAELRNIRILRAEARAALAGVAEHASVDHFYVNFPDPWPKKRHAKHRLIQPESARLLVRLLRPGGGLSLRTDSEAYAAQMLEVLEGIADLRNLAGAGRFSPEPRDAIPTRYELKYRSEGRSIRYLEYQLPPTAGG